MSLLNRTLDQNKLTEVLLRGNYVTAEDLAVAQRNALEKKIPLGDELVAENLLTKDLFGQVIAELFETRYLEASGIPNTREKILRIPEELARTHRVVFVAENPTTLTIASDNPELEKIGPILQEAFPNKTIEAYYTLPEAIEVAFKLYKKPLTTRFTDFFNGQSSFVPEAIDEIIADAIRLKASDIHFEPRETGVGIRFRIDGSLLEIAQIPKQYYENILNRIKILAHLPIDEHFRTQDGSIRHSTENLTVNVRVSIAPTINGEKIALRLLSQYINEFTPETLGMRDEDKRLLMEAAQKPFGMILVVGPTGSGKTTTLYALLNALNRNEINITTIEDPVEYKIDGINQMQTNIATDLTFARGLRSIVRQDPDVVLVGEIRDGETAEIAVNAALTGHLLFSTFHANDASTTIPRLFDIGIEPFLLGSTLELIISQRLVRKICNRCKISYTMNEKEIAQNIPRASLYFKGKGDSTLYRGKGCDTCHGTGFSGRIAIFEIIRNTPAMQELIEKRPAKSDVWELAKSEGAHSLFDDGIAKVKEGVTTLEELLRVATPQ